MSSSTTTPTTQIPESVVKALNAWLEGEWSWYEGVITRGIQNPKYKLMLPCVLHAQDVEKRDWKTLFLSKKVGEESTIYFPTDFVESLDSQRREDPAKRLTAPEIRLENVTTLRFTRGWNIEELKLYGSYMMGEAKRRIKTGKEFDPADPSTWKEVKLDFRTERTNVSLPDLTSAGSVGMITVVGKR